MHSLSSGYGSTDFALKALESAAALSVADVAHENSGFCKSEMFSWPMALVSKESISSHHPLEEEGSDCSLPGALPR